MSWGFQNRLKFWPRTKIEGDVQYIKTLPIYIRKSLKTRQKLKLGPEVIVIIYSNAGS